MFGYGGNILTLDLTTGEGRRQPLEKKLSHEYLGGDGFGAYFMNKIVDAKADVFSRDNTLLIAPGLFVGTAIPTAGKTSFFQNHR